MEKFIKSAWEGTMPHPPWPMGALEPWWRQVSPLQGCLPSPSQVSPVISLFSLTKGLIVTIKWTTSLVLKLSEGIIKLFKILHYSHKTGSFLLESELKGTRNWKYPPLSWQENQPGMRGRIGTGHSDSSSELPLDQGCCHWKVYSCPHPHTISYEMGNTIDMPYKLIIFYE